MGNPFGVYSQNSFDAGNRLRVSQLTTLLDVKQINDNAPLFYDRENIAGATQVYSKNNGGSTMSVSSNGDAAIAQTKMFAPYFSGKGQFVEITFSGMNTETGVTKRAGYFSSNTSSPYDSNKDGIWFEASDDYYFVIEKNGVEVLKVPQSQWEHKLPHSDFSNFNVFLIQFLYLGGTAVRLGFIENGIIRWCYTYIHAGLVPSTFVESPNQPIRYEIRSTGGSGSFIQVCGQVASEGSIDEVGVNRAVFVQDFDAGSATTYYATLGIRLKSDYRNIRVDAEGLSVLAEANDDFQWFLCLNPTIGGAAVTWNSLDNSAIEYARGANVNVIASEAALGVVEDSGLAAGNSASIKPVKTSVRIGSQIDGTMDELWLCVYAAQNGLDFWGEISFNEFT